MRLRRETGDFSIKFDSETTEKTIVKGLNAEALIGAVIEYNGGFYVTSAATEENGVVTLISGIEGVTITYTAETGVVAAATE